MDKKDYLDTLKNTNLRPEKIKIIESEPVILNEQKIENKINISELFIKYNEISSMPSGKERDIQILRLSIVAELDASNLYEQFAKLTSSKNIKKIMLDISREEKVHAGEFETLLENEDSEYEDAKEEGKKETNILL